MALQSPFASLTVQDLSHDHTSPSVSFEPFELPLSNQRHLKAPHPPGTVIPLALKPSQLSSSGVKDSTPNLNSVIETVSFLAKKGELNHALAKHGALLFRGIPIHDAEDFSKFSHAFGYQPHEIIGIVVDRPLLAPNVAPANEAALTTTIGSHNESPQVPHAPAYVFFYGHQVAKKGGETPIGSSLELFRLVNAEIPEFIEDLSKKGVLHTITYKPDPQYKGGSTLAQAFGKHILPGDNEDTRRSKIEAQIHRYNRDPALTSWTWAEDGSITVKHILPAIRTQPETNLPTLFTSLAAQYGQQLRHADTDRAKASRPPAYGDGSPIPTKYLDVLLRITEEIRVLHKWQRGDVLVFDNRKVAQHGREPWEGEQEERRVFASLWDGELPGTYNTESFAALNIALPDISNKA